MPLASSSASGSAPLSTFNSLFEMLQVSKLLERLARSGSTFNSLFEMLLLDLMEDYDVLAKPFNSLFEMPL